jgi:putative addiction module component (TIGR02574 family)
MGTCAPRRGSAADCGVCALSGDKAPNAHQNEESMGRPTVFAEALALSEKERLELAAELLASAEPPSGILVEGTPALRAELRRRVAVVKSGKVRAVPWREAKQQLQRSVEEVRASKRSRAAGLQRRPKK